MGIILRQSAFGSIIYYLRIIITSFNVLWLFPFILTTEQVGLYKFITATITLIASIAQFGLSQSIIKYLPEFQEKKTDFFSFIILFSTIGFLLFGLLFFIFKEEISIIFKKNSPSVIKYFPIIISSALALLYSIVLKSWARANLKTVVPSFIQNIVIFFLMSCSVVFYYYDIIDYDSLILGILIIYTIGLLLMALYIIYIGEFKFSFRPLPKKFITKFIVYNLYTLVGSSGFTIVTKIDGLMIVSMIGLKANGIYASVLILANLIEIPRRAVKQISIPILSRYIYKKDIINVKLLYKQISINQSIVGGLIFMLVLINLDSIVSLVPNYNDFKLGKMAIFFLSLAKITDSIFSTGGDIIILSRHFRYNIVFLLTLSILTIVTNMIMIPLYGISGAAAASAISYIIYNILTCIFVYKKFEIHPLSLNLLKVPLVMLLAYGFIYLLNFMSINIWMMILIRSIGYIVIYLTLSYLLNISPDFSKNKIDNA